jgi:hypothetical protein
MICKNFEGSEELQVIIQEELKTSFIHNETEWSRSMRHFMMCIFILRVLKSSQLKAQPSKGCYNVRNYQLNMPPYFLRDLPLLHLPK